MTSQFEYRTGARTEILANSLKCVRVKRVESTLGNEHVCYTSTIIIYWFNTFISGSVMTVLLYSILIRPIWQITKGILYRV